MTSLFILFTASGLLLTILGFPLLFKKVKPNPWYGFRTGSTLADPRVWYAVNRYAAVRLIIAGISFLVSTLIFYFVPGISVDEYAVACAAVFSIVMTLGIIQSVKYLRSFG
jgi:uncharacterized membrane protein